jgi:predicted transcriptional regulator
MSTTTIRIEDDLKTRVAAAAHRAGKTAHAFILDAISQTVEQVELDNVFNAIADQRWAKIQSTDKTVAWSDAKTYLAARARGEPARKPKPTRTSRKRTA